MFGQVWTNLNNCVDKLKQVWTFPDKFVQFQISLDKFEQDWTSSNNVLKNICFCFFRKKNSSNRNDNQKSSPLKSPSTQNYYGCYRSRVWTHPPYVVLSGLVPAGQLNNGNTFFNGKYFSCLCDLTRYFNKTFKPIESGEFSKNVVKSSG